MAIGWNYNANDVQEFPLIPEGNYRVRIEEAEETTSRNGNDMIRMKLAVSGQPGTLFYYMVFMPDNKTQTNTNLKRIYDSFGIEPGNLNAASWVGKVGAAKVSHEEYNGKTQVRVAYLLDKKKQEMLPPWSEEPGAGAAPSMDFSEVTAELPFDAPFTAGELPL